MKNNVDELVTKLIECSYVHSLAFFAYNAVNIETKRKRNAADILDRVRRVYRSSYMFNENLSCVTEDTPTAGKGRNSHFQNVLYFIELSYIS